MKIQQYAIFEFKTQLNTYGNVAHSHYQTEISHVETFLYDAVGYVYRKGGPKDFLDSFIVLENGDCGITFDLVDLNIDRVNNIVYLGQVFDAYEVKMTDEEFNRTYNNMNALQLCQNNIVDCAAMTRENFIKLLTTWGQLVQKKSAYILLYLDDQNWYDALPFDSKEAMEQFIADHVQ